MLLLVPAKIPRLSVVCPTTTGLADIKYNINNRYTGTVN